MSANDSGVQIEELEACLNMLESMSLTDEIKKLQMIRLSLSVPTNLVRFFDLAVKRGLDILSQEVVKICCCLDPKEDWPIQLTTQVIHELRKGRPRNQLKNKLNSYYWNMIEF